MTNKTQPTADDVTAFLNSIEDEQKRADAFAVMELMQRVTGEPPVMWGSSIVGFGSYHYKYESGREGDFLITGFSPRKAALTLYIMPGFEKYAPLMKALGPHKMGKSCLYLKRLSDVDLEVLEELIDESYRAMKSKKVDECP